MQHMRWFGAVCGLMLLAAGCKGGDDLAGQCGYAFHFEVADQDAAEAAAGALRSRLEHLDHDHDVGASGVTITARVVLPQGSPQLSRIQEALSEPMRFGIVAVDTTSPWLDSVDDALNAWNGAADRKEPERIERVAGRPASAYDAATHLRSASRDALEAFTSTLSLPEGRRVVFEARTDPSEPGPPTWRTHLVHTSGGVEAEHLKAAEVAEDSMGNTSVETEFTAAGTEAMAQLTRRTIGKLIAVTVDDEAMSVPIVREEIRGGRAQLTLGAEAGDTPGQRRTEASRLARALVKPFPPSLKATRTVETCFHE